MKTIAESLSCVREQISRFEGQYGRNPGSVSLIAVSKTRPTSDILEAYKQGQRDFGENYLQEALEKIRELENREVIWHFIGPVQSNKTHAVAGHFHWVHSIDRAKTARRLSDARPEHLPPLNTCLQVNISHEVTKAGVPPGELAGLIDECMSLPRLKLRGLMALPAPGLDFEQQRDAFRRVRELLTKHAAKLSGFDTLSIGTTQDMEAAIAEGATFVRVGTAIFGERS